MARRRLSVFSGALVLALCGCATRGAASTDPGNPPAVQRAAAAERWVPGELLVQSEDPSALDPASWPTALGRDDFDAAVAECLGRNCRIVLTRRGEAAADAEWTRQLADALRQSPPAGVLKVELNHLATAK